MSFNRRLENYDLNTPEILFSFFLVGSTIGSPRFGFILIAWVIFLTNFKVIDK